MTALLLLVGGVFVDNGNAVEQKTDYWYVETIQIGDVVLPQGIEIVPSDPAIEPRGSITITNNKNQPVYVMSLGYKDVLVMSTPDANWERRVNGAHEAASYLAVPNRPAHLSIESLTSLDLDLNDQNVLSADPPPQNAPIPATQSSELLLVYNGQVIEVPFTISYSLNTSHAGSPEFSNAATQTNQPPAHQATPSQTVTATGGLVASSWVVAVVAVSAIVLVGFLIWRLLRRNR